MKTLLVATAVLGLGVSGALAECGHDVNASAKPAQTTASLDMSTTASTATEEIKTDIGSESAKLD